MYVYGAQLEDKTNLETRGVFNIDKNKFRTDQNKVLGTRTFTEV